MTLHFDKYNHRIETLGQTSVTTKYLSGLTQALSNIFYFPKLDFGNQLDSYSIGHSEQPSYIENPETIQFPIQFQHGQCFTISP